MNTLSSAESKIKKKAKCICYPVNITHYAYTMWWTLYAEKVSRTKKSKSKNEPTSQFRNIFKIMPTIINYACGYNIHIISICLVSEL